MGLRVSGYCELTWREKRVYCVSFLLGVLGEWYVIHFSRECEYPFSVLAFLVIMLLGKNYYWYSYICELSQYSVWLRTGGPGFDPWQRQRIFLLTSASRPALGLTQPSVQWVPGVLSPGVKRGQGVMLTTHPYLVPRLRMSRSYTSSPLRRLHGV
jgi:hypothetical protein